MKKINLIILLIIWTKTGYCNQDAYAYLTFGNLKVKIEISQDNLATDKAYMAAEFCGYLTNSMIPNQSVYLEIYTLRVNRKDDFLISFDNGLKTSYENFIKMDRNRTQKPVRQFEKTDSLSSIHLVIRYISLDPDYKKLLRLVQISIQNLDKIKREQSSIEYKWSNKDWIINSMDTTQIHEWVSQTNFDDKFNNIIRDKKYISKLCTSNNKSIYSYFYQNDNYSFFNKTKPDSVIKNFKDLSWFALADTKSIYFINDSTFFITDSELGKISKEYSLNKRIYDFQNRFFSKESKYAVKFSLMNWDNIAYNHEIYSWIYRPIEEKLMDVSKLTEKQIRDLSKK